MIHKDEAIKKGVTIIDSKQSHNQLLENLKANFPETIKDNQVDLKAIATLLGLNDKADIQGYELTFTGKGLANALYSTPTQKLLTLETSFMPPHSTESVIARQSQSDNEAIQNIESTCHTEPLGEVSKSLESSPQTPQNFIIRGDNLDALKILKSAYTEKIKMIYIDPPYNTKNENFIYPDNFRKDYQAILQEVGLLEIDENGEEVESETLKFFRNIQGSRTHSGWLAFMLPRLKLARDLLKDDGVIFISIDDNEQANLKILCDEIFGEENFVAQVTWHRKRGKDNSAKFLSRVSEYILIYAKNIESLNFNKTNLDDTTLSAYTNPDNDTRGAYRKLALWRRRGQGGSKAYSYTTNSGIVIPEREWLCSEETMRILDNENKLIIINGNLYRKLFLSEHNGNIPETIWLNQSNTANGKDEIKELFNNIEVFETPKPIDLLKYILKISTTTPSTSAGGGGTLAA